jgi:hypothetical protein
MKFLICLSFIIDFLFCTANSSAQSYGNEFPAIGTNFIMAKAPIYPAKKIGIRELGNQTWDLSGYLPTSYDTIRLKDPMKTRYGRRFPESNVAMVISPVHIEYLAIDSGRVYLTGLVDDFIEKKLPLLLKFQDSLLYKNPRLTIDEEYSDTSGTTFLSPYYIHPATDSIRADITYIRSGRVDASGQLITPLGKYNVDREVIFIEKIVKGYKYTVFGWTPAPEYSLNKHYTIYRWYTKDLKLPIAEAFLNEEDYVDYITYQYDSPLRLSFSGDQVKCKGGSDGTIEMTVTGGIPDYTYEWSNGANTKNLSGLKAGTYNIKVTDNRGRKISTFYTVTEPHFELEAKLDVKNVSCKGMKDGKISLVITGGTAPYDFKWSNDSTNETISRLSPGKIHLYVVDAGGCYIHDSIEITQPEEKLSVHVDEKQVSCFHGGDGSSLLLAEGGTSPYHFLWADGDTSGFRQNMKAGQYKFTALDKNNCTAENSVIIKEPESPLKLSSNVKAISCFGDSNGSIELSVTGGKQPYHYLWKEGSEGKSLKGISYGNYSFTITDRNGCQVNDSVFVPQPSAPLKINFVKKDVDCFGENSGEININVSGGTPVYSYSWSDGSSKPELSKIKRGNYIVKVSDKNQCMATETIEISEPEKPLGADFEKYDVKCNGGNDGSISLTVEGGTPDYSFLWSNKSVEKDVTGLKAANYSVVISDKNNCKLKKEFEINQPDKKIEIDVKKSDVDCYGSKSGSISVEVKGGKPGYDFEWSNNATLSNIIGVGAGKYTLSITDNALCKVIKIIEITEPDKLTVKPEITQPDKDKNNGSIKIEISGGTKPYQILWDDGKSTNFDENLKAGEYEVQITDAKDCRISEVFKLEEK